MTNVITVQSRLNGLEVNNYKNFSLMYAADKRENIRNSAFFAFYQAIICWLLIMLTLPFRHIPKNNLRNTLSLILRCYVYLLQKAGNKDFVFKKEDFLFKTQGSLTAKHR